MTAVHPRVCGERPGGASDLLALTGSSPRVRGTPSLPRLHPPSRRFIPACAGNAFVWRPKASRRTVHPRVCGERTVLAVSKSIWSGSSPRVRGTPPCLSVVVARLRFIPACAGNAHPSARPSRRRTVHPRVCGERFAVIVCRQSRVGSSPRVRGTRDFGGHRPF